MSHPNGTGAHSKLSSEQCQLVLITLQSLLDSPHFSKSARYPALLEFVVRAALEEDSSPLKERTVGAQVFGRPVDYDTSVDSVVRSAAGEVRRRMAAYFSEHPEAPVRIDIPAGHYQAAFHFRSLPANGTSLPEPHVQINNGSEQPLTGTVQVRAGQVDAPVAAPQSENATLPWITKPRLALAAMFVLIVAGAGWSYQRRDREYRDFWGPVLGNNQAALILGGRTNASASAVAAAGLPEATAFASGTSSNLPLNDAIVIAQVCSAFREHRLACDIVPATSANIEELRGKSVVLVGGCNNPWTLQLLASLPYQFQFDAVAQPVQFETVVHPAQLRVRSVVEHKPTGNIPLGSIVNAVNTDDPSAVFAKDYAILARFHSDITDGMAVIVAGIGLPGTSGAGQVLNSPEKLREILSLAPKDWKGDNFEVVLQIDVVRGGSGQVKLIASHFW